MFEQLKTFLTESIQELRKVTWPARKEIVASSAVVLVVAAVFMVMVAAEDWFIAWALGLFY